KVYLFMVYKQKSTSSRQAAGRSRTRSFNKVRKSSGSRGPAKKYINPEKFTNKAVKKEEETPYEAKHAFSDFPFGAQLKYNVSQKGYVVPSAIQDQAIPHIINGCD